MNKHGKYIAEIKINPHILYPVATKYSQGFFFLSLCIFRNSFHMHLTYLYTHAHKCIWQNILIMIQIFCTVEERMDVMDTISFLTHGVYCNLISLHVLKYPPFNMIHSCSQTSLHRHSWTLEDTVHSHVCAHARESSKWNALSPPLLFNYIS